MPAGPGRPCSFQVDATSTPDHRSRHEAEADEACSTTSHLQNPRPSHCEPRQVASASQAAFFQFVLRIRARDPVLCSFPLYSKASNCPANHFSANRLVRQPLLEDNLGSQLQGPKGGGLAELAGRSVQQCPQLLALSIINNWSHSLRTP